MVKELLELELHGVDLGVVEGGLVVCEDGLDPGGDSRRGGGIIHGEKNIKRELKAEIN